jgi:hypothetical protein
MLEAERMSACMVRPILNRALTLTKSLDQTFAISPMFTVKIENRIVERFGRTDGGQLFDFLFHLTPAGRFHLRLNADIFGIKPHGTDSEPIDICEEPLEIPAIYKAILDDYAENQGKYLAFATLANDIYAGYSGKLINPHTSKRTRHISPDVIEDSSENTAPEEPLPKWVVSREERRIMHHLHEDEEHSVSPEEESEGETEQSSNDESDDEFDEDFSIPDSGRVKDDGPFQNAFRIIRHLAKQTEMENREMMQLFEYFFHWITDDPDENIPDQNYFKLGSRYWELMSTIEEHRTFATFVLPLLSIPASEGIVERAFWYQRRILGDQGMRMSASTEKARMNLAMLRRKK